VRPDHRVFRRWNSLGPHRFVVESVAVTGPNRIDVLLDAAIEVVAAEGLRGLTHRAVDARAGLSAGSTSYYYRTRMALLEAVLGRVLTYDVGRMADVGLLVGDRAAMVEATTQIVRFLTGPGRAQLIARLELTMDAVRRPDLRRLMDEAQGRIAELTRPVVVALGSTDPGRDTALLLTLIDGLLLMELKGEPSDDDELRRRIGVVFDAAVP
jgi:DNA-binding transcriptional regulator YbjK